MRLLHSLTASEVSTTEEHLLPLKSMHAEEVLRVSDDAGKGDTCHSQYLPVRCPDLSWHTHNDNDNDNDNVLF